MLFGGFHLNGLSLGFHPKNEKLEPPCIANVDSETINSVRNASGRGWGGGSGGVQNFRPVKCLKTFSRDSTVTFYSIFKNSFNSS